MAVQSVTSWMHAAECKQDLCAARISKELYAASISYKRNKMAYILSINFQK